MTERYEPTERTQLRRKPQRGVYDAAVVHSILDAGLLAHIAYVDAGQAVVTPTTYWREGGHVYWHGSAAGRALRAQLQGRICLTVSMVDGVVLGRSGFTHSMLYRSVMAFGVPELVADPANKRRAMDAMLDGLYPGRTQEVRPSHDAELAAISVVRMRLEEVSAKVRDDGVVEVPADLGAPCWAGIVPFTLTIGAAVTDPQVAPGIPRSAALAKYVAGRPVETALVGRGG